MTGRKPSLPLFLALVGAALFARGEAYDVAVQIDVGEGVTRVWQEDVSLAPDEGVLVNVASNGNLTILGNVDAGVLMKRGPGRVTLAGGRNCISNGIYCEEGIVSIQDAATLEGTGAIHLSDGTFEFVGDGSGEPQVLPCPLVCQASKISEILDGIVDLKIEAPLTITNITLESGCIFKRGVGTLTFAPALGSTTVLSVNDGSKGDNGMPDNVDIGNITADGWPHPRTGFSGFNVVEGEFVLVGDATTTVRIPHKASLGLRVSSSARVAPSLVIDGVTAELSSAAQLHLSGPLGGSGGPCAFARLSIVNGANVTTKTIRTGGYANYVTACPTAIVDRATWSINTLTIYGPSGLNGHMTFIFRNQARGYLGPITEYEEGNCTFIVTDSVLAKNAALDPIYQVSLYQAGAKGGYWYMGSNAVVAIERICHRRNVAKNGDGPMRIDLDGVEWRLAPNTLRLTNAWQVVMTTLRDIGASLYVAQGKTSYVGRAVAGAGGIAKTGDGELRFELQSEWTGDSSPAFVSNLTDAVTLAFGGVFDVREGSVFAERGACRTGGCYRAAGGTVVDFNENDLGAGVTFSGGGTFKRLSASNVTLSVPLDDSLETTNGAPAFASATLGGGVFVDLGTGYRPQNPKSVVVATFDSAAPSPAEWSASRAPTGFTVRFLKSADGKRVLANICHAGMSVKIR